jgi:hypothetical protein
MQRLVIEAALFARRRDQRWRGIPLTLSSKNLIRLTHAG